MRRRNAVFLALAALYESWSIPFSVMLVVPLGVLGGVNCVGCIFFHLAHQPRQASWRAQEQSVSFHAGPTHRIRENFQ